MVNEIDDALKEVSKLALDTAPIIYFIEANPAYDNLVSNIINRVAAGEIEGWTSVISLSEVLVQPIVSGRNDLQQKYREFLFRSSNFHTFRSVPRLQQMPRVFARRMAFVYLMPFK